MPLVRKPSAPLKKIASSTAPNARSLPPRTEAVDMPQAVRVATGNTENDMGNAARIAAGARPNENGFTCVRCLQWFPAGTHHQCRPAEDLIFDKEGRRVRPTGMSAEEIALLQADGQL